MIIDSAFINRITNLNQKFNETFNCLDLSNSEKVNTLSFLDSDLFVKSINDNSNITGVITTEELAEKLTDKIIILSDDPRFDFYTILNKVGELNENKVDTVIDKSAEIHSTAFISETNVIIGRNTVIEPNVTILSNVEIGDNCIIRAGTVIGAEGFEQKRTKNGILAIAHFGKVIIKNNVHIGALNGISKGMVFRDTIIDDFTRTDNLVHIAHGVNIGKRCFLPASCMIAGSVTIKDDVWVGPNSSITSGVTLENSSFVTIGAVVTKSVSEGEKVTGNFAIPHSTFLKSLKKTLND